ncbi:hypothetical protein ACTZWT_10930 [Rhodopseudomonas sp. NSM]|uniref:ApeA N-terminal domain 1-containing protein n=1 Tax=Rhodopseudomonas sp. NSM TaxID=3457630 RepID=UPI004036BF09
MLDNSGQKQFLAHFAVQGTEHAGVLNLDGMNTKLDIFSKDFLHLKDEEMNCVRGVSKEGFSISAIYCVPLTISGSHMTLQPNYVVIGAHHLEPEADVVTSISFTFTEANHLFYELGTFGHIVRRHRFSFGQLREILRGVRRAPKHRRRGGRIDLYYRWDRGAIIESCCKVGIITIWNATSERSPSSDGFEVRNRARVTVSFISPCNLEAALRSVWQIMSLFELVTQSCQNVEDVTLEHKDAPEHSYLDLRFIHRESEEVKSVMPTDVLVNGGLHEEEFKTVLTQWMDAEQPRGAARQRFIDGFRRNFRYRTERLIGAANAFDLLPASDFTKAGALPDEVELLLEKFETQVRTASKTSANVQEYRERILNNLSLVRSLNLRSKVLQRWATVPSCISSLVPEMPEAIAHSIRARNFFVHGSPTPMATESVYELSSFFTDTLEFVFGVSELCSCGWNAERWLNERYSLSRYKWYISNFSGSINRLEAAIAKHKTLKTM